MTSEYFAKRPLDFLVSALALFVFSPVLLATSICVFIFLGRPVIFKQSRAGVGGAAFEMYKFRSMTEETDSRGELLPDQDRLTRFGKLLRASSIDELPELFNVLLGQMSIVGPRPLPVRYVARYSPLQMQRLNVRPGITGLAQVSGRNRLCWNEKFELDIDYVHSISWKSDLNILYKTVGQLIFPKNINSEGHATAEEFKGNSS